MIRFGFTARLMAIFIISLLALQIIAMMFYFTERSRNTKQSMTLPLPDQIAALVELFETAPAADRDLLLRAVNSTELSVRLTQGGPPLEPETWKPSPMVEAALRAYLGAVSDRRVTVLIQPGEGAPKRGVLIYPSSARILVNLKTGETLDIATTGVLSIKVFGFPPGFWASLFGFLIAILVFLSVRGEAKPLRDLAAAADRLDIDNGFTPLPDRPRGAPEIRSLVRAFNRMQERLSVLIKARVALVSGVSHDLKTFATRLRLRIEHIPDESERGRAIADIDSIMNLIDDAVLALHGKEQVGPYEELIDVAELLREETDDRAARGEPVSFAARRAGAPAFVLGGRLALKRLFNNLIDNAVRYGHEARVAVAGQGDWVSVTVDDRGPGIPEEHREAVFEPFVRLENSRSRDTGGAGLGLAIVKSIVLMHGGRVAVGANERGGGRVSVSLPAFAPDGATR
ncbi:MAG: ATP-binding protein [Hyphomicrobiales bacterium]|nr:ATP-binding protein [Hyphomicrobiales bacterium]